MRTEDMNLIRSTKDHATHLAPMEFHLEGWPALFLWGLLIWMFYLVFFPSEYIFFSHFSPIPCLLAFVFGAEILRNSPWSPIYIGPTLRIDTDGISGRGGLTYKAWHVAWSDFDSITWGRFGIAVHTRGMKDWQIPFRQSGPFGCRPSTVIARVRAYVAAIEIPKSLIQKESTT